MKKKIWVFFIYCAAIIGALVLFLVFYPKSSNDNETPPTTPTQTYATNLRLNCSKSITISVGTSAKLLSGYLTVAPESMVEEVETTVVALNDSPSNGITFAYNAINANTAGTYKLTFSVPKSKTTFLSDSISITIVEKEQDNKVEQIKTYSRVENVVGLTEIFNIDANFTNINVESNSFVTYENNTITGLQTGETVLSLSLIDRFISYNYMFDFLIKAQPLYYIHVENVIDNKIEVTREAGESLELIFSVIDKNSIEAYSQIIDVNISDESVAVRSSKNPPIINLTCLSKGSFYLTISSEIEDVDDRVIYITIK